MQTIRKSDSGIEYLVGILRKSAKTITKAVFWKIPHKTKEIVDICLKVGRYDIVDDFIEVPESIKPRSELTLDNEEFNNLLEFISSNHEPFKKGAKTYIPLDGKFDKDSIDHLRAIFENPDKQTLLSFIAKHDILRDDLVLLLQQQVKIKAVEEFETMLSGNLVEQEWQEWFKKNDWVLGSEFVKILDEREIDTENIADYLMEAYDGFLDIVEIKRPEEDLRFWADTEDHHNQVPSPSLIKAITQASKYIFEVEREVNSLKFQERVGGVRIIKPRCILIFGRSDGWTEDQKEAYRILNSSYHNLTILTYDHVLQRAKKMLGLEIENKSDVVVSENDEDDIPF
jgi:hypothetical protein